MDDKLYLDYFTTEQTSIELRRLGVPQKSFAYYLKFKDDPTSGYVNENKDKVDFFVFPIGWEMGDNLEIIGAAFTSSMIGNFLPPYIKINGIEYSLTMWSGSYNERLRSWSTNYKKVCKNGELTEFAFNTCVSYGNEAEARASMLIHLLQNGFVYVENDRIILGYEFKI